MRFLITVLFLVLFASVSSAAVPWLSVTGGYNSYGLDPIADGTFDSTFSSYTLDLDSLDGGSLFGLSFGVDFESPWALGLAYERLSANSSGEGEGVTAESDLPVHIFKLFSSWYPVSSERFKAGVGVGVGIGYLSGFVSSKRSFPDPFHGEISESSAMFNGQLEIEYSPVSKLWLTASVGMRHVTFDDVTVGFSSLIDRSTGDAVPFDYSGPFAQMGLKWVLPGR